MKFQSNTQSIHKFHLPLVDYTELELPLGAIILKVEMQNEMLYIWALVVPSIQAKITRKFRIFGTGQTITETKDQISRCKYWNTVQEDQGRFIWHIFEQDCPEEMNSVRIVGP